MMKVYLTKIISSIHLYINNFVKIVFYPSKYFNNHELNKKGMLTVFIPLIILILISTFSRIVYLNDYNVKRNVAAEQIKILTEQFKVLVENGKMTEKEFQDQIASIKNRITKPDETSVYYVFLQTGLTIIVKYLIIFFTLFIFVRFYTKEKIPALKIHNAVNDSYNILILKAVLLLILSIIFSKVLFGFTIDMYYKIDRTNLAGFILSRIDIFDAWFCVILGYALSKTVTGAGARNYIYAIFLFWIISILCSFLIIKGINFTSWFFMG